MDNDPSQSYSSMSSLLQEEINTSVAKSNGELTLNVNLSEDHIKQFS